MALLNPVSGLVVPFLFIFTIPLAIFAGITTTLAFSVLMFRVAIVYLDIAIGFIPQYLMGRGSSRAAHAAYRYYHVRQGSQSPTNSSGARSGHTTPPAVPSLHSGVSYVPSGYRSPRHRGSAASATNNYGFGGRRSRRSSQVSLASAGTITSIHDSDPPSAMAASCILPSVGIARDFEGVGGWRLDSRGDDSDWANINSRLELPLERSSSRHHPISSGGATTPGEGSWLMMKNTRKDGSPEDRDRGRSGNGTNGVKTSISPNSSRVRVSQAVQIPSAFISMDRDDGYFPHVPSPKSTKKVALL